MSALCLAKTTCVIGVENFNSWSGGGFTTNFGLTGAQKIGGVYSGSILRSNADQYGGSGGTGAYPELFSSTYNLDLTTNGVPGVNYFGLWFSALDPGNLLQFFSNNTLVFSFSPADFANLVGPCNGSNPFCGNPNSGQDGGEQFAYLNFFDIGGTFDRVSFSQTTGGGFESDNHAVGYITPNSITGTPIFTPEPKTWGLSIAGSALLGFAMLMRRRLSI